MDRGPFTVGALLRPKSDDARFADEGSAIEHANAEAVKDGSEAIAVWDAADEPLWLFHGGEQWRKV